MWASGDLVISADVENGNQFVSMVLLSKHFSSGHR